MQWLVQNVVIRFLMKRYVISNHNFCALIKLFNLRCLLSLDSLAASKIMTIWCFYAFNFEVKGNHRTDQKGFCKASLFF